MFQIFTNRRLLPIALILIASNILITSISIFVIYKKSIQSIETSLIDIVERQKTLVTILHEQGKADADIIQLIHTMRAKRYSIGKAGEFAIAIKMGDSVKYLLALGPNPDFKQNINKAHALPMQIALSGKEGFVKAKDYQDNFVFAAYTFVPQLKWGIVAKIPASEIYKPYFEAFILTYIFSFLLILLSLRLFIRLSNPILKSIVESEEKYRQAIQNAPFPIMIHSEDGRVLAISQGFTDISGYTLNDIPTIEAWTEHAYGIRKQIVQSEIDSLYELKGRKDEGEYIINCKNGAQRTWDFSSSSLGRLANGKRTIISMAKDVTERNQNEHILKEHKEEIETQNEEYQQIIEELQLTKNISLENQLNYFQLFENMEQGFALHEMIYDENNNPVDYRFVLINKAFEQLTNINATNYIGKTIKEVFPNTEAIWIETYGRVAQTGESMHFENYSQELKKYYDVVAYSPTKNHFAVVFTDNTERRKQDIIIQQNNARLKILLGLSQMVELDTDQIFNYALEKSTELCNSKIGFLGFLNEQETIVTIHTWSASTMKMFENKDKYIDFEVAKTNIWGEIIRQRKPLMMNDFIADNPLKRGLPPGHFEITNYLSLPVFDKGKIIAIIAVGNKAQDYNETDIHELTLFIEGVWNVVKQRNYEKDLIIAKKQAEESAIRLEIAQNASNAGTWDWNISTNTFFWSADFLKVFGMPSDTIPSIEAWTKALHPDDIEIASKRLQDAINSHTELISDYRIINPYKPICWIRAYGKTFYDGEKPMRMVGLCLDITSQKIAEQEIIEAKEKAEENENRIRSMFSSANTGMVVIDANGKLLEWNETFQNFFGYNREEFSGLTTKDLTFPDDLPQSLDNIIKIKTNQIEHFRIEKRFVRKDKSVFWVDLFASSLKKDNAVIALLGVVNDISDRKNYEKNLIKAKEHAEQSDRLKTAFLQNMSHEIRTPMNAIMGFSELLVCNYGDKSKLERFSHIINQRCADLLVIIEGILDIAKIESGQLPVNIEKCNVNSLFEELKLFFMEQQIRLKKQQIKFILHANCDNSKLNILTDKVKLKQIFINLIGNAFKFTDTGLIEGGCQFDDNNNLIFYVSDTGIGIPSEKQQLIFERFMQVEQTPNRLYGGTGLGLSIVKGLVELLGGKVWLKSEIGRGTTFYFSIPYNLVNKQEHDPIIIEKPDIESLSNNKTILVVEDDTYNLAYIKEILSDTGLIILDTQFGNEAIQIAATQTLDLVLMDIGLPDITGYEATRQIKLQNPHLKVIAQTAYAASEDKQKALEAGCSDYISKPLKSKMLISLLAKHLSKDLHT